ncbi:MAG TPA: hypothetical protein VEN99_07070, partial [Acidimicrobiia bacterium]|nr:hypothetical protein [Acidimicrobiia bacterium]
MNRFLLARLRRVRRRLRRRVTGHDPVLIGSGVALAGLGVVLVAAATRRHGVALPARQLVWAALGVA